MKLSALVVSFTLAVTLSAATAMARDIGPAKVKAGKPVIVVDYASYNPKTCYFTALPILTIVDQPVHGTLTLDKRRRPADPGRCEGSTFTAAVAIYKPAAGFRGRDEMTVDVSWERYTNAPGNGGERLHIVLDVE